MQLRFFTVVAVVCLILALRYDPGVEGAISLITAKEKGDVSVKYDIKKEHCLTCCFFFSSLFFPWRREAVSMPGKHQEKKN